MLLGREKRASEKGSLSEDRWTCSLQFTESAYQYFTQLTYLLRTCAAGRKSTDESQRTAPNMQGSLSMAGVPTGPLLLMSSGEITMLIVHLKQSYFFWTTSSNWNKHSSYWFKVEMTAYWKNCFESRRNSEKRVIMERMTQESLQGLFVKQKNCCSTKPDMIIFVYWLLAPSSY